MKKFSNEIVEGITGITSKQITEGIPKQIAQRMRIVSKGITTEIPYGIVEAIPK